MARNYIFAPGEYYHVYARGVEKLPVYREDFDYQRFVEALYLLNNKNRMSVRDVKEALPRGLTSGSVFEFDREETIVDIGAYCLMPNHFHLLLREKDSDGKGVSKFMQKLMTSYTMYTNKKYERTGALFGSSFKARHVTDDVHLKYLFAYIHLNPRDIAPGAQLREYAYSSYSDYLSIDRPEKRIITPQVFPDYFSGKIEEEINEWLDDIPLEFPEVKPRGRVPGPRSDDI